ncbi:preprotein translocase subunit SecG [Marinicella sediminis]|uniref:Protein-export membrane protein SecG n=1 Tax=Marinicella sediminis TaxID=1792834 RepID=A0ABV7JBV3_9GAMM|nr:preprotein translocase subunit SecG [Marinicella sediminis]
MTINFLNIFQVIVAVALIGFILIQRGPGATAGSAFGGGASGTVFGAKGSGSFLTKATAILATAFFIITMLIAIDARDTYSATDEAAEQDLGVFGTLDEVTQEPAINPVNEAPSTEAVLDAIDAADETAAEVLDDVQQAATDVQEEAAQVIDSNTENTENTASEEDSDGGNK